MCRCGGLGMDGGAGRRPAQTQEANCIWNRTSRPAPLEPYYTMSYTIMKASRDQNDFPSASDLRIMMGSPPPAGSRVTLGNWQDAPWNRWSYLHLRELMPTALIRRGQATLNIAHSGSDLARIPVKIDGVPSTSLAQFVQDSWTDAVVVVNRGRIVVEEYRAPMAAESRHLSMSVGKSITSLVTGALAGQGLLSLRAQVSDLLPELARTAFAGASVQHALDMTVAPVSYPELSHRPSGVELWDVAAGWRPAVPGLPQTIFDLLAATTSDGSHGRRMLYSDLNPDVLGLIAERATGMRFADVVSEVLWIPAGMEFDADITVDRAGTAAADGGYCAAARDHARIGQLVLQQGVVNGRQVVPESWISECSRPHPTVFNPLSYGATWPGASYHNQWWQMDGRLFAIGVHGQMIAIDQASQTVVVFLSSAPEADDPEQLRVKRSIVGWVAATLQ
jgi:CubicO group peptidase (beta-lactamase class C family)